MNRKQKIGLVLLAAWIVLISLAILRIEKRVKTLYENQVLHMQFTMPGWNDPPHGEAVIDEHGIPLEPSKD